MIITNTVGEKQIVVQLGETVDQVKAQMLEVALENNSGNLTKVSKALGISYRTVMHWRNRYASNEVEEFQTE